LKRSAIVLAKPNIIMLDAGAYVMTASITPLIATEVIDCITEDRDPTVHELFIVAGRIWVDGSAHRSAFAWEHLAAASTDRVMALRAARLALCGDRDVMAKVDPGFAAPLE
jgi:hypothetical protein